MSAPTQAELLGLFSLLRPWTMRSHTKLRVGAEFDGGYVLPHCALACDSVVSIGIGNEVSFDLALAQRGAHILQYDHTVEAPPQAHANFHFHKKGWGRVRGGDFVDFSDIEADLRALSPRRSLLKFDVEGAEYEGLADVEAARLKPFDIIACELHFFERLAERPVFETMRRTFTLLSTFHVPVHLHANNALGMVFFQGMAIPRLLEVSYLRRDLDVFSALSTEPIPGPLDRPNLPQIPDLCLNVF